MNKFTFYRIFAVFFISNSLVAQIEYTILVTNKSFEGTPQCCNPPSGWIDCGWRNETPPDIQPSIEGKTPLFGVITNAFDGQTYLGMVTRENGSYERVSQKLSKPLRANLCYSFSIYLCRSSNYLSASNNDINILLPFTNPIVLRVFAGDGYCNQKGLLGESSPIDYSEWKKFSFEFSPKSDCYYIELEAFYNSPDSEPYNGNILLDNASDIVRIECVTD